MPRRRLLAVVLASVIASAPAGFRADFLGAEEDYRDELPRIEPRSPSDSLEALVVLEGFRVELVAAEPQVADPVSISFDESNRLWVVCMRGYSEQADENLGEVRLLEDTDGDGRFEASAIFADGLSWPTAVIRSGDGVFVAVAPDILYLEDTDGDRRADVRRVAFTGFGRGNVQGLLNSFRWGLDNRIHGATSSSGGTVRVPGRDGPPLVLGRRDFSFDPRTLDIAATSGGAQHGLSFDDWGRKFVCSNSSHAELVMYDERHLARNPHLAAPGPRVLIATDGGQAEVFRLSPVEPWRIVRTRLRVAGAVPGPVEGGGRPAGYFTGSTGITVYRGDAWPDEFRGQLFVGDVGSNLVHRKRLEPDGVGLRAMRADRDREFLASREIWFRPVQLANAPDGTLHVIDMYREVIEHPASLPPVIKRHLDLTSGRDRGRIWRVVWDGQPESGPLRRGSECVVDRSDTATLVRLLEHPNAWHRETAQRLLFEKQDHAAVQPLERLARRSKSPVGRLHALATLDGLGALAADVVVGALADPHPRVRERAVLLAERVAGRSAEVRRRLHAMTADDDMRVRYQLAFVLGELEESRRLDALAELARRDGADTWMRIAIQSSLARGAGRVLALLLDDERFRQTGHGGELLRRLAAQVGARGERDAIAEVLAAVRSLPSGDRETGNALLASLGDGLGRSGSPLEATLGDTEASELFDELLANARSIARDREADAARRAEAARTLALGSFSPDGELLVELVSSREPVEVQRAALSALSRFDDAAVPRAVIAAWPELGPEARRSAAELLFGSAARVRAVLDAIEGGALLATDLDPVRVRLLRDDPDPTIRERARELLGEASTTDRSAVVAQYRDALDIEGDPDRGRKLFEKSCATCHRVGGVGNEIGPNLVAMLARGAESVVLNVLDPNREVAPEFIGYLVVTRDGRSLAGAITSETATALTLRLADGRSETILRSEIRALRSSGVSFMPEGLEKEIDVRGMADLLAFLAAGALSADDS